MPTEPIDAELIARLRAMRANAAKAVAAQFEKFNRVFAVDPECAIIRGRRALDVMIRSTCAVDGLVAGTKPLENLISELVKARALPAVVERHCRVVKEFGNLAAHGTEEETPDGESRELGEAEGRHCAASLACIAEWYLKHTASPLSHRYSWRVIYGNQVDKQMLERLRDIDTRVYPGQFITHLGLGQKWLARNPDIYTVVLDAETGLPVAYTNAMPLEKEYWDQLESGAMVDVTIPPEGIKTFEFPEVHNLYIASIAVDPVYQNTDAFRVLLGAFVDRLLDFARRDILFQGILADAVTEEGKRLVNLVGMTKVCDSQHSSGIYKTTLLPPKARIITPKGRELLSLYQRKYEELKDMLE